MKPEAGAGVIQVKNGAEEHFRQKEEQVPAPWGEESVASSREVRVRMEREWEAVTRAAKD